MALKLEILLEAIDRISGPVRRATQAVAGLGRAANLERLSGAMGRLRDAAGQVATRLAVLSGTGVAAGFAFNRLFVRPAADAENLLSILQGFEGSLSAARSSMGFVREFAANSTFQILEVGSAFVRMRALGLDARRFLPAIGEAAAALRVPLSQATEAFADAATGEFERLKEFGITASRAGDMVTLRWQQNGRQMSRTINASNREIVQSTLAAIWNSAYAGNMARSARSWDGMVSMMSDAWTDFATRTMNAGLFDWMKGRLGELLGLTAQADRDGALDAWAQRLSANLIRTGELMQDFLLGQRRMLNPDSASEMGGLATLREGGLLARLGQIGDRVGAVFERVHQVMRALFGDLHPIETMLIAIAGITFAPLIASLVALGVALGAALVANPAAAAGLAALAALGAAGAAIYQNWDGISDWFSRQMQAIENSIRGPADAIERFLGLQDRLRGSTGDQPRNLPEDANPRINPRRRASLMGLPGVLEGDSASPSSYGAPGGRMDLGGTLRIRIEDGRIAVAGRLNDPRARLDINQGVLVGAV